MVNVLFHLLRAISILILGITLSMNAYGAGAFKGFTKLTKEAKDARTAAKREPVPARGVLADSDPYHVADFPDGGWVAKKPDGTRVVYDKNKTTKFIYSAPNTHEVALAQYVGKPQYKEALKKLENPKISIKQDPANPEDYFIIEMVNIPQELELPAVFQRVVRDGKTGDIVDYYLISGKTDIKFERRNAEYYSFKGDSPKDFSANGERVITKYGINIPETQSARRIEIKPDKVKVEFIDESGSYASKEFKYGERGETDLISKTPESAKSGSTGSSEGNSSLPSAGSVK